MTSTTQPVATTARRLLSAALVLVIAGCFVGTYWWTFQWMVARWNAPGTYYSHGWLVPIVSGYALWRKRRELASLKLETSRRGLALLVGALLLHVVALAWRVGFVSGFSFLLALAGLVWYVAGGRALRIVAFPLVFLVFMVPIPTVTIQNISFQMKMLAAAMAMKAIGWLGVIAVREGSFITLGSGEQIVVDDICSGLRYLISLLAFTAVYAYLSPLKRPGRLLLLAGAVPLALAANVCRIVLMTLVADHWGVRVSERPLFHTGLGFAFFIVAFVLLVLAESVLLTLFGKRGEAPNTVGDGDRQTDAPASRMGLSRPLLVSACVLATVTGLSLFLIWPRERVQQSKYAQRIPLELEGWQGQESGFDRRTLDVLGTDDVVARRYAREGDPDIDFAVIYAKFTRRATHPPEICMKGSGWLVVSQRDEEISLEGPGRKVLPVRSLELNRERQAYLLYYFYKTGKSYTSSYWKQQVRVAWSRFRDPNASDALIRVVTPVGEGGYPGARARLSEFLSVLTPHIDSSLP